jgi:hypothetical protein
VAPGNYWVVETKTPDHYDSADPKAITVELGDAANEGDTVEVGFVNPRQHRIVVLVCHEGTDTLYKSDVTVDGETKTSIGGDGLAIEDENALCRTGGASFGDISGHPSDVVANVDLSAPGH